jgi:O-antigen/teichoic acid export membrane protein
MPSLRDMPRSNADRIGPSAPVAGDDAVAATAELAPGADGPRGFAWGFVSQGLSSATNLGLSLLGARVLGPGGLGSVAIGFASYLTILGFQRALVTEPLVATSSRSSSAVRARSARQALSVALAGAAAAALVLALAGLVVGGDIGWALAVVAPWIPCLVLQDFWRAVLFRDGRARAAAANDASWLVAMAVTAPVAWWLDSLWAVVACWGVGALVGALLGFVQTRTFPDSLRGALRWWRDELWALGRWLGATSLLYSIMSYATIFALAALIGTSGLGGIRAVATIFAPLTLIGAAIALPGLPALTRALAVSHRHGVRRAFQIGIACTAVTAVYFGVLSLGGGAIVSMIFGHSFEHYGHLVWPIGIGQIVTALAVGFGLLLKAEQRGSAVLVSTIVPVAVGLAMCSALAAAYGVTGAAWGMFAGAVVGTTMTTAFALRLSAARAPGYGLSTEAQA